LGVVVRVGLQIAYRLRVDWRALWQGFNHGHALIIKLHDMHIHSRVVGLWINGDLASWPLN
jgi:hypothetical protein